MRWSNGRNTNGTVSPATQQAYGMDGTSLGANSPTGTLSSDLSYDPGLRVVPAGNSASSAYFQEALPSAPSRDLMNFITASTGGSSSPYQFNTAGMTYGPTSNSSSTENPQYFSCASITCLAYGANYNPNNPINQAQQQEQLNALGALGLIVAAPFATAFGGPAIMAAGVAAQTVSLTEGIAGVTAGKWISSAFVGFTLGAASDAYFHSETATPATMFWSGAGSALGATAKLAGNAYLGLANQWIPTTVGNIATALFGSQVVAPTVKEIGGEANLPGGASWWNEPLKDILGTSKK